MSDKNQIWALEFQCEKKRRNNMKNLFFGLLSVLIWVAVGMAVPRPHFLEKYIKQVIEPKVEEVKKPLPTGFDKLALTDDLVDSWLPSPGRQWQITKNIKLDVINSSRLYSTLDTNQVVTYARFSDTCCWGLADRKSDISTGLIVLYHNAVEDKNGNLVWFLERYHCINMKIKTKVN